MAKGTFPELWAGFRWFLAYSVLFFFSSYRSPPPLFVLIFRISVDTFSSYPRCGWHVAMASVDDLFLPLKTRPPFLSFSWTYLAGFVALPFRDVGVGFEEPHLRLMF